MRGEAPDTVRCVFDLCMDNCNCEQQTPCATSCCWLDRARFQETSLVGGGLDAERPFRRHHWWEKNKCLRPRYLGLLVVNNAHKRAECRFAFGGGLWQEERVLCLVI